MASLSCSFFASVLVPVLISLLSESPVAAGALEGAHARVHLHVVLDVAQLVKPLVADEAFEELAEAVGLEAAYLAHPVFLFFADRLFLLGVFNFS